VRRIERGATSFFQRLAGEWLRRASQAPSHATQGAA
jgi:hypothetical protein